MAEVIETIGSGQDRATITLWESNVGVFGTDFYHGIISTNDNFNEAAVLTGSTGTPSITSYLWLDVDPANRHAGAAGTGHARMYGTHGNHIVTLDSAFARVSWVDIKQDQDGTSDEGVRVLSGADDALISYCIIWTDITTNQDQDGVYTGDWDIARVRVDNCIFYGWQRAAVHPQQFGTTGRTISYNIDHCTFFKIGDGNDREVAGLYVRSNDSGDAVTIGAFNCWSGDTNGGTLLGDGDDGAQPDAPAGSVTFNGSHNADDDGLDHIQGTDNTTNRLEATDTPSPGVVSKTSGSWFVVTNLTAGSIDLTLLDDEAGNILAGGGVNRQGSEPDARQDFSVAIDGPRPTDVVDIGASQISVSGAGPTASVLPHFASMIGS